MRRKSIKSWYRKCCKLAENLIGVEDVIFEVNYHCRKSSECVHLSIFDVRKDAHVLPIGEFIACYNSEEYNIKKFKEYESVVSYYSNKK